MAKFNWDRTQTENTAASHGSESFTSDSLPSGYARGGSKFSPQIVKCPHCGVSFTVGLLPNHFFNCRALKRKRPRIKNEVQVIKKAKAKKPKLKVKNKKSKVQIKSIKSVVEENEPKLDHPLKGVRIVLLVRKKT